MFQTDKPNLGRHVDARSDELLEEFEQHAEEYLRHDPGADQREIFDGWALQKIACLQLAVEALAHQLNEVAPEGSAAVASRFSAN